MKITSSRARAVSVPRLEQFRPKTAHGERARSDYVVLELFTDAGAVGLGEATVDPGWSGEDATSTVALLNGPIGAALLDGDPLDWPQIARRVAPFSASRPFLLAALEMACLDLLGKQADLPVASILGGPVRTEFVTKFVVPARDEQVARRIALEAFERGARTLKVKVGLDVAGDLARVNAVREAVPAVALTVDANEGWSESDALLVAPQLDELGVACIEQPVSRSAWGSLAAVRNAAKADIAGDESIWSESDVLGAAANRALDVVCVYPGKFGGIRSALAAAQLANAHGMSVSVGSNLELGIGSAAMAQLLAAIPELSATMPSDLIGPLYHEHSLVADGGFVRFDGASLPRGPGLGVELDEAAVRYFQLDTTR